MSKFADGVDISKSKPYQRNKTKLVTDAATDASRVIHNQTSGDSVMNVLRGAYRLAKPFTLVGLVLTVLSVCLLAVEKPSDITPLFFLGAAQAVFGIMVANMYVAGINQVTDIEIDKVNKPYLPLASGIISKRTGILLTSLYAFLGFLLGWSVDSWALKCGLLLYYTLGTVYSINLPYLRWKRFHVLNALTMTSGQAVVVPIFFYLHAQTYIFGRPAVLSKHILFVTGYMSLYVFALALFKDICDVEGDTLNGMKSFAMKFGQTRVFWFSISLLEVAYGFATLIGFSSSNIWVKSIMVLSHSISGYILWKKANLVDVKNSKATGPFYLVLWKFYYLEYLLVPTFRF